jgi:hypothetical protein
MNKNKLQIESGQSETINPSRRRFFGGSAKFVGAGIAAYALNSAMAQTTTGPSDLTILNYALGLENLEAAYYNQGLTKFAASDFTAAKFMTNLSATSQGNVYNYLKTIRDHENAHVTALTAAIKGLGGTPVAACTYNFPVKTPDDFIAGAMLLENTGVSAYDGVIGLITSPDLRTAAASIATVEARHAAYLNELNGAIPFPATGDTPQTMAQITLAAASFITSCPTGTGTGTGTGGGTTPAVTAVANPKNLTTVARQITLDATSSTSANTPLTYVWSVLPGPSAALINPNSPNPIVQFDSGYGNYTFQVVVTDSKGNTATDTVSILYVGR